MFEEDSDYGYEPENGVTVTADIHIGWSQKEVMKQVVDEVSRLVYDDIKVAVEAAILKELESQVRLAIATTMESEVQPTDRWGKTVGSKTTVREMLQRDAETWLTEKVDYLGRTRDRYGEIQPRIHWLFHEALDGPADSRSKTALQSLVLKTIKDTLGDIETLVDQEVKGQIKKALKI